MEYQCYDGVNPSVSVMPTTGGFSGSPIFNTRGEVIGLSHKYNTGICESYGQRLQQIHSTFYQKYQQLDAPSPKLSLFLPYNNGRRGEVSTNTTLQDRLMKNDYESSEWDGLSPHEWDGLGPDGLPVRPL